MNPIEAWYFDIPIISRIYVSAAVLTSLAVQLGFVTPFRLYLSYQLVINKRQYWRLVTNFLYFGPLTLDFMLHMFFLVRYSRMLEEGSFYGRPADFLWLMIVSALSLLAIAYTNPLPFLGAPLAFTLVYIWARRNPHLRLNFLGLFNFSAPYLPWLLLGFAVMLNNVFPTADLMGIVVGHFYYFFEDVWPRRRESGGVRYLKAPRIIVRIFSTFGIRNIDDVTDENNPNIPTVNEGNEDTAPEGLVDAEPPRDPDEGGSNATVAERSDLGGESVVEEPSGYRPQDKEEDGSSGSAEARDVKEKEEIGEGSTVIDNIAKESRETRRAER